MNDREYFLLREQAERMAARRASCFAARRAHQELARLYRLKAREAGQGGPLAA